MTATTVAAGISDSEDARLSERLVHWLETGEQPADLFADDVFADLSLPHWRLQGDGPAEAFGLRAASHPHPGQVTVRGLDSTSRGFLIEFEERWRAEGQSWYCRELIHCHLEAGRVTQLSVYCTGDWDEAVQQRHADQVRLSRP